MFNKQYIVEKRKHKEVTTIGIKAYFNDVPTLRHNSLDEHIIGAVAQCLQIILVISKLDDELDQRKWRNKIIIPEGLEVHERSQCPKLLAPGKCKKPTVMIGAGH